MNPFPKQSSSLLHRLVHRFILMPLGAGKPVAAEALDKEYSSGAWDHFWGPSEQRRHELLVEMVNLKPSPFSLLDIGCGSGRFASMLDPQKLESYLGLDLSEEGLRKSQALGLPFGRFEKADYTTWNPPRTYDIITFNESLGYAPDPAATARRYASHLSSGGWLIVSHFRWGNHAVIWKKLRASFAVLDERSATNDQGQIWDLKILLPKK